MEHYQSDWVFDIALRVAVIICLATLAMALYVGVGPITAVFRSGTAFAVFAVLGWAAALVWKVPEPEPDPEPEAKTQDNEEEKENKEAAEKTSATIRMEPQPATATLE